MQLIVICACTLILLVILIGMLTPAVRHISHVTNSEWQVWDFPHREEGEEKNPWDVNFGFGANVVMDQGRVEPKFRLRAQHVALHLLPEPALEMRGKWPLGNTNLAVYARYRLVQAER